MTRSDKRIANIKHLQARVARNPGHPVKMRPVLRTLTELMTQQLRAENRRRA